MDANERREKILSMIQDRKEPIKGTELAKIHNVSRQIIVQDVAILRAAGEKILATSQGYLLPFPSSSSIKKTIACAHSPEDMFEELAIMVDMGAKIIDVIVDHPVYGEIKSTLMISSRRELHNFIEDFKKFNAEPLSSLTEGVHLHTIEVPDLETYKEIIAKLQEGGYLVKE